MTQKPHHPSPHGDTSVSRDGRRGAAPIAETTHLRSEGDSAPAIHVRSVPGLTRRAGAVVAALSLMVATGCATPRAERGREPSRPSTGSSSGGPRAVAASEGPESPTMSCPFDGPRAMRVCNHPDCLADPTSDACTEAVESYCVEETTDPACG